ncbi:hypothetical protein CYMTET_23225 [Cymbomonas tetramitiformis]|uniref:Uncharacterized protein n=1 Tax=Cymbomonas tetramitiformis TaxID=36881 RepID=A0AAE0L1F1_9CHLO|nr:hypothetical protein CYMTET_23225 [Cymbomonas tetramitiformis]
MVLTAPKRKETVDRRASPLDMGVVKGVAKSSIGDKPPTTTRLSLFDLVDNYGEVNDVYDDVFYGVLVYCLTAPGSSARRRLDTYSATAPRDGKRAFLEVTKRLLLREEEPLGHVSDLMDIKFPADVDPEPLILDYYTALAKVPAALGTSLAPRMAKRQLLAVLNRDFYKDVRNPLVEDVDGDRQESKNIPQRIIDTSL